MKTGSDPAPCDLLEIPGGRGPGRGDPGCSLLGDFFFCKCKTEVMTLVPRTPSHSQVAGRLQAGTLTFSSGEVLGCWVPKRPAEVCENLKRWSPFYAGLSFLSAMFSHFQRGGLSHTDFLLSTSYFFVAIVHGNCF